MRYVLLINTDKMQPVELLRADRTTQLTVLTKPKYAPLYQDFAEVFLIDDVRNITQAQEMTIQILRRHPIDRIIAPYERSLLTGGFLRSYFDIPGPSFEQVLPFTHKLIMKNRLQQAGIPITAFTRLNRLNDLPELGELLGWPVIVKPAIGSGAYNTYRIESAADFWHLYERGQLVHLENLDVPLVLERYVEIEAEYHCDGLVHHGQVVFAAVSRYFDPLLETIGKISGSYALEESDPALQPILQLHEQVIQVLELKAGVTHLEVFGKCGDFLVGEIACRPAGGGIPEMLEMQFGVNLWRGFIRSALDEEPDHQELRRPGVFACCGLPAYNGRISSITPVETIISLPGVQSVESLYKLGEVVEGRVTSGFFTTLVYLHGESCADILKTVKALRGCYHVEVEVARL